MKSLILILGSATLIAGLGYVLIPSQSESPVHPDVVTVGAHVALTVAPTVSGLDSPASVPARNAGTEAEQGQQGRHDLARDRRFRYLQQLQTAGGNLQQWFNELRQRCGAEVVACHALLGQELEGYPDADFVDQLRALLPRYLGYEQAMSALVMSGELPPGDRYQRIDDLRVELLGEAGAELLFGQERAWAAYQFGYEALLNQASAMTPAARLQALERLRRQSWQGHFEALASLEGAHGGYRRDKELLLRDVTDHDQRAAMTAELRVKHYGEEEARVIALREEEISLQQQQREGYRQARIELQQSLNARRSTMDEAAWQRLYQESLQQLRRQWFSELPQ
ncbi:lipase secretion chaperone [Marinobacter sp. SS21]|uniref:lipase secretion chaperone n=1 Tax=Marinobacter sp. SS21 TaxID=2979460 RepID=UPI00232D9867|nr:lipase secretion chaperone [Marinobacter sp. SS21]MDC0661275.1 lipase secretion chaperone [Marinobacter sp. SS21]